MRGLHSSDSGADLSEYSHQDTICYEQDWQRYWSQHGEKIIFKSWCNKFHVYINPEYIDKLSFNSEQTEEAIEHQEITQRNQMLVRNLSGSDSYDKLNSVQSEGWNQLSPTSNDLDQENERLLSSRCGSVASSTAKTFATTDSMTNVTHMTTSSVDLSDSSKSSESISSPISSIQSSEHNISDPEETVDSDQYWQAKWKSHYEEQYKESYNKFMLTRQMNDSHRENSPGKSIRRYRYTQKSDHETHVSNLFETLVVQDEEHKTNAIG